MSDARGRRLRSAVSRGVRRVHPGIDQDYWRLGRARHARSALAALGPAITRLARGGSVAGRPAHLIVIPDIGPSYPNWHVGGGNLMFEAWQSAIEVLGADAVTLFDVGPEESERDWHARLLDTIGERGATHVLAQIEEDPNRREPWSWDVLATALARSWDGAFIGFMYDSAHPWLQARARRMGRLLPNLLIADLCVPVDGFIRPRQFEVGPLTMPMSRQSVEAIDAYVEGRPKEFDVTFIGALYDYRVGLLDRLRDLGFTVAVNPHRTTPAHDYLGSRSERPSYLDYMAGLARSELTVNFSLASGGPHEQYKIRVQEASLVGCLCLTDDADRTRHFFGPDEYAYFPSLESLPEVVHARLADRETLRRDQQSARHRAHELARTDFWGRIDDGLRRRGLPQLTGLQPPAEPGD